MSLQYFDEKTFYLLISILCAKILCVMWALSIHLPHYIFKEPLCLQYQGKLFKVGNGCVNGKCSLKESKFILQLTPPAFQIVIIIVLESFC